MSSRESAFVFVLSVLLLAAPHDHGIAAQQPARTDTAFVAPIEFQSAGITLRGSIHVAAGAGPHHTVVRLQGFPGVNETGLEKFLQSEGINGVSIHFRGQLTSDGSYLIANTAEDASAAVAFLRSDEVRRRFRIDAHRISLLGASAGTWAALSATAADPTLGCVAAIVPFNWGVAGKAARTDSLLRRRFDATVASLASSAQGPVRPHPDFVKILLEEAEQYDLRTPASALGGRAVYLVGARNDQTAPLGEHFDPLRQVLQAAPGAALRDTIFDDSHNLPNSVAPVFAGIARWVKEDCAKRSAPDSRPR